jgi:DnaJ domain
MSVFGVERVCVLYSAYSTEEPVNQRQSKEIITLGQARRKGICLSCGTDSIKPGRRYCSKECRHQIDWVLSLSKGLLRTFNARYAAFYFDSSRVILDVLPVWSRGISRFSGRRVPGNKPATDLKNLILDSGDEWYRMINNRKSRSYASLLLLQKNHREEIDPGTIKPNQKKQPRLKKGEKEWLKMLNLDAETLLCKECHQEIRTAYRRMARVHHPDAGGDEESFKRLNEAHERMLLWTENPQFSSKKALPECWSYDGATNRWTPPL